MLGKKLAIGAIALLALTAMAGAGAISASSGGGHGANGIVGSWEATVDRGSMFPSLKSLQTFTSDGTLVESGSDSLYRSPSFGVWDYVGDRTFATTMVLHRFSPTGVYLGTQRINANRQVSPDGETYTAVAVSDLFDPNGNLIVGGLRSTATARRMHVERIPDQP